MKKVIYLMVAMLIFSSVVMGQKYIYVNSTNDWGKANQAAPLYKPQSKQFFQSDTSEYKKNLKVKAKFYKSDSIIISNFELYNNLQKEFGIQDEQMPNPNPKNYYNGIRIYPALRDTTIGHDAKKNVLYLIFVPELVYYDGTEIHYQSKSISYYFVADKDTIYKDVDIKKNDSNITNYYNYWNTTLNPNPQNPKVDSIMQSFSCTIKELNALRDSFHFSNKPSIDDTTGFIFFPSYESVNRHFPKAKKSLFFTIKGYKSLKQSLTKTPVISLDDASYFDSMDGCPDKCPTTSIYSNLSLNISVPKKSQKSKKHVRNP